AAAGLDVVAGRQVEILHRFQGRGLGLGLVPGARRQLGPDLHRPLAVEAADAGEAGLLLDAGEGRERDLHPLVRDGDALNAREGLARLGVEADHDVVLVLAHAELAGLEAVDGAAHGQGDLAGTHAEALRLIPVDVYG